ncbi:YkvA family protein [Bordetella pseudohinzii]|uniref:Uncharacterized conserved protein n=1 Tax=Bordetella pseudohinzii TaxID=1331258 RepID=A0A0J6EUZ0_9BORD|nr:YkvA family protein [Bordetella pseudohinzii]ANY15779.1 hypothetical protein BBN53_07600 [Bordetella pseudohinzii]KMM24245.1 membrane protein [Bordetella pseudohinzii]KXA78725.1 hypothetical protein AW877_10855 [Bordetella pseudohinzii]KXA81347.1 hypothetical protein AW878_04805 [Bordetella pseudohinzii]CUI42191.1 Uncharacterized conserved protein [Bordetella pseudohinzii]
MRKIIQTWAKRIKRDGLTLWFAVKHPDTPWYAKAVGLFAVAYALSPIDLIPDFIPILGYLDDAILLPGLIWLAVRLLPKDVLAQARQEADAWTQSKAGRLRSRAGAVMIVLLWAAIAAAAWAWFVRS